MSPLPVRMIPKKEVVLNSVAEFLGIWAVRGEASLSLKTKDGVTTIAFHHTLSGHPEDPLHQPPAPGGSPPKRRRRRRGPARRERDRQRAARHQAALAGAPLASQAAAPAALSTPEVLRNAKGSSLDTLTISPTIEQREELVEEDPSSPSLTEVVSHPASVQEAASLPPSHLSPATSTSVAPAPSSDGKKVEEWKCILNCGESFSTRKELSKHLTSCFKVQSAKCFDMAWG